MYLNIGDGKWGLELSLRNEFILILKIDKKINYSISIQMIIKIKIYT